VWLLLTELQSLKVYYPLMYNYFAESVRWPLSKSYDQRDLCRNKLERVLNTIFDQQYTVSGDPDTSFHVHFIFGVTSFQRENICSLHPISTSYHNHFILRAFAYQGHLIPFTSYRVLLTTRNFTRIKNANPTPYSKNTLTLIEPKS